MSVKSNNFRFDKRAASYDEGFEGKFSQRFYDTLLSHVELQTGYNVLDVGCGTGYLLRQMSARQKIQGYGIDVEPNMIHEAKQKCPDMDIRVAPCEDTGFKDNCFDVVTACMAYHHFSDKEGFAREVARILKPDGVLYIADPYFPYLVRKAVNGLLRLFRVTGRFFTAQEMVDDFERFGFTFSGVTRSGIVQVIALRKT